MTSQPGCNSHRGQISRSKGNQAMEFDQLTEYKIRTIFLEKSVSKCGEESIPRPFSKKLKFNISLNQYSKVRYSLFLLYAKWRATKLY